MPSESYQAFRNVLLSDVDELIKIHKNLKTGKQGKQRLGHINRSALFLLCAGFEYYLEEACVNFVEKVIKNNALDRCKSLQKALAKHCKGNPHELYCLRLIGQGWKECLLDMAKEETVSFNSPKATNI